MINQGVEWQAEGSGLQWAASCPCHHSLKLCYNERYFNMALAPSLQQVKSCRKIIYCIGFMVPKFSMFK